MKGQAPKGHLNPSNLHDFGLHIPGPFFFSQRNVSIFQSFWSKKRWLKLSLKVSLILPSHQKNPVIESFSLWESDGRPSDHWVWKVVELPSLEIADHIPGSSKCVKFVPFHQQKPTQWQKFYISWRSRSHSLEKWGGWKTSWVSLLGFFPLFSGANKMWVLGSVVSYPSDFYQSQLTKATRITSTS